MNQTINQLMNQIKNQIKNQTWNQIKNQTIKIQQTGHGRSLRSVYGTFSLRMRSSQACFL